MPSLADQVSSSTTIPPVPASDLGGMDSFLSNPALQKYLGQQEQESAELKSKLEPIEKDIYSLKPPELAKQPEAPKQQPNDPWEAFGSPASWLMVFGSLLTRQPLTNALNGAAGVMNARKQNNDEEYKKQFETWKANTDNAIKLANFEMDAYKAALEKDKTLAGVLTSAFKNDTLANLKIAGLFEDGLKNQQKQIKVLTQFKDDMQNVEDGTNAKVQQFTDKNGRVPTDAEKWQIRNDVMREVRGAEKGTAPKGAPSLSDEQYTQLKNSPEVAKAAEAMHAGMLPSQAMPGFGANNPLRQAAQRLAAEKYPDDNLAVQHLKYIGQTSEARTLENKAINVKLAANVLDKSIPSLIAAAEKVGMTPSTDFNSMIKAFAEHTNDPDYQNLQTQMRAVTTDYAQLIGRGRQTVHSDEEALSILNAKKNVGSIKGFQDAVTAEKENLQSGIKQTEDELFGDSEDSGAPKPSSQTSSPPIDTLEEGHNTTYANGQVWTLKGGKPVQVK